LELYKIFYFVKTNIFYLVGIILKKLVYILYMSTVRANIYSLTSGADIGTIFAPYTNSQAVSTGMYAINGSNLVDLNTMFQKYTGANGTAEATGLYSLSGGVYFDLNTRFEKYGVAATISLTSYSGAYTSTTNGPYTAITLTTGGTIKFNITSGTSITLNYIMIGGGGGGGSGGFIGASANACGGSGGGGGQIVVGTTTITKATNYTVVIGNGGAATANMSQTSRAGFAGNAGVATTFNGISAAGGNRGNGGVHAGSVPGIIGATGKTFNSTSYGAGGWGLGGSTTPSNPRAGGDGYTISYANSLSVTLGGGGGGGTYAGYYLSWYSTNTNMGDFAGGLPGGITGQSNGGGYGDGSSGSSNQTDPVTGTFMRGAQVGKPNTGSGGGGGCSNGGINYTNSPGRGGGTGVVILWW
jgi:hypothetical protein